MGKEAPKIWRKKISQMRTGRRITKVLVEKGRNTQIGC